MVADENKNAEPVVANEVPQEQIDIPVDEPKSESVDVPQVDPASIPLFSFGVHRMPDGNWVVSTSNPEDPVDLDLLFPLVKEIYEALDEQRIVTKVLAQFRRALGGN